MLTKLEKEVLCEMVKKEQEHFRKSKRSLFVELHPQFIKAEHEYVDFLSGLLKKLQ